MMSRCVLMLITLALLIFAVGCKNSSPSSGTPTNTRSTTQATPDPFASARASYAKDCQNCHQPNGEGGTVKLDDGSKLKVPSLREGHALRHPDSDFLKQITKGGDGMPAFGDKLKPEQMNDLIRFIRHEFQGGMAPPPEKSSMQDMKK